MAPTHTVLLLSMFLLASSALALSNQEDPELRYCRRQCQQQGRFSERELKECESRCEDPEERLRQCQRRCETQHHDDPSQCAQCQRRCQERYEEERREQRGSERGDILGQGSPEERLQQCQSRCETQHRHDPSQRSQCQRRCQERYEQERRGQQEPEMGDVLGQGSPEERLQQCQRRCETQHRHDPRQRTQCQRQCEERYEQERRGQQEPETGDVLGQGSPEERLRECQRRCETQHRHDQRQRSQCQRRCQERYEEERKQQQERGGRGNDEEEGPQERLQQCRRRCRSEGYSPREQSRCERDCQQRYEQEQRERGGRDDETNPRREEGEEQQEGRSPYFFDQQSFRHRVRTEHGNVRMLERFTKRSELLRAIEHYRLAFLEANPNAFVLPHHIDADTICYVAKGRGTIKLLRGENRRESYDIRRGDIITVHAGTVVYMVNTDSNEKLHIAKLVRTVSTPGVVRGYFGVGGEDPESFFRSFSDELLQAAFNAKRETVERMFGRQTKGAIVRASQEQVRAMSRGGSSEGERRTFGESTKPFNLLSKRPTHSSRYGQLYEATAEDCRELRDLDVQVSFANISSGSMTAPYYLTRSTKMIIVLEGDGIAEMACPHMAGQRQERPEKEEETRGQARRAHYQKVRSRLSCGTAFIVPAGHPVAIVASRGQNLQVLCFEINAKNNQRIFLSGKNNILKQLESEAKELSFNMPSREVDEFLNRQQERMFIPGPEQQRQGKSLKWASILDFAGF
ncbi:hypothetical protein Taro_052339 [Colocasia esculenta]|uniref:Cupin type-1 domain-containing protein n=1 Tax=Colocasia esculenta TaxID=4460 RepID=A0A843XJX8_COLES|nr:hypothetical protein [Colocasia esculenta]